MIFVIKFTDNWNDMYILADNSKDALSWARGTLNIMTVDRIDLISEEEFGESAVLVKGPLIDTRFEPNHWKSIVEALYEGSRLQAIKHRRLAGADSLLDAKAYIDHLLEANKAYIIQMAEGKWIESPDDN